MDDRSQSEQQDDGAHTASEVLPREPDSTDARGEMVRDGRRRAALWGILTGLAMTIIALGCILLLYLALGR